MTAFVPTPDLAAAQVFLDLLGPGEKFTFMAIPEGVQKGRGGPTELHGTLSQHAARLTQLNNAGQGVFVMVNEGDLKGRKATNVLRVRALFVDLDGAPIAPLLESAAPPHILVESSPDKWHSYWRMADCPLGKFKERQHALADRFSGDKSVCDLPRVMILPGFWHLKTAVPFQTRLVTVPGEGEQR
ncbi:MAG: DNA-primase RepB domain-containing protein [Pseudomonadota bacterium]